MNTRAIPEQYRSNTKPISALIDGGFSAQGFDVNTENGVFAVGSCAHA